MQNEPNQTLKEFHKRKRGWIIEVVLEFTAMFFFFFTYFTNGDTNTLIFWTVMFFWSKTNAGKAFNKIMELKP